MTKECKKCEVKKPLEAFRVFKGYVRGECRECEAIIRKEHYASNPKKFAAASRKWSKNNPEKRNATKRAWYAKNKARHKDVVLRRNYGISLKDYDSLFSSQGGKCAICKEATAGARGRSLFIDHCHVTGRVRGLLCGKCNTLLGFVNDRPDLLDSAKEYLAKR